MSSSVAFGTVIPIAEADFYEKLVYEDPNGFDSFGKILQFAYGETTIEYPPEMDVHAKDLITQLLNPDEMARIGARGFPTRGAVWQAARRMADIYKARFDLVKVAEVCAEAAEVLFGAHGLRDTYASMPMPSYDLDTRLEAQWTATGCDIQALRPPALAPLAAQVECDSRGGRASPGGFCRCLPGFSGPSCSQREAPVPTDTSRVCLVSKEFGSIRKGGIGSAFAQLALFLSRIRASAAQLLNLEGRLSLPVRASTNWDPLD